LVPHRLQVAIPRFACLGAVVTFALVAVACGDSASTPAASSSKAQSAPDSLNLMHDGELTVGAEMPVKDMIELPYSSPKGFEVDLVAEWAKRIGIPKVKWVNTPFSSVFSPGPKKFDMSVMELTILPERAKVVDFSDPYLGANLSLLARTGTPAANTRTTAELKGLRYGCQVGGTGCDYINDVIKPSRTPREYSTVDVLVHALLNGQIDATVNGVWLMAPTQRQFSDRLTLVGQFTTDDHYGVMFPKGNDSLRRAVNKAIADVKADGTADRLQRKWFPETADLPVLPEGS
jgi:polar amino acid transport system substrate-binding protein